MMFIQGQLTGVIGICVWITSGGGGQTGNMFIVFALCIHWQKTERGGTLRIVYSSGKMRYVPAEKHATMWKAAFFSPDWSRSSLVSSTGIVVALKARAVWYGTTTSSTVVVCIIQLFVLWRWRRLRFSAHRRASHRGVVQRHPNHAVQWLAASARDAGAGWRRGGGSHVGLRPQWRYVEGKKSDIEQWYVPSIYSNIHDSAHNGCFAQRLLFVNCSFLRSSLRR